MALAPTRAPDETWMASRVANNLNPASLPFFPSAPSAPDEHDVPQQQAAPAHPGVIGGGLAVRTSSNAGATLTTSLTPGPSPYSPYSPYGQPGRQGSLALSSGSTSPPRFLNTGPVAGSQFGSPISGSRPVSRENSLDPHTNGDQVDGNQTLTPQAHTAKSGSVSSSSPPQDYLSANFGQYSIQPSARSPASSVRSMTLSTDPSSFDAHAKASPFLNDILDRLIRCEYTNRDIHRELQNLARNVSLLVEHQAPALHPPRDDELKQLNQRVSALTASVSQLMQMQTQSHLQNMNANFNVPSPVTPQLALLEQPAQHNLAPRASPRGPIPARTWSSGNIELPSRGLAPDSVIRGPDKRRSVSSLIRRDSASVCDFLISSFLTHPSLGSRCPGRRLQLGWRLST